MSNDIIPNGLVEKRQPIDDETELLLESSHELKDGMVVVLADPNHRVGLNQTLHMEFLEVAQRLNRWCRVTDLDRFVREGVHMVRFIGVYGDGTRTMRAAGATIPWVVKKYSIPID